MKKVPQISIKDYIYDLPKEKIAYQPLANREQSKLLVYHQREVNHDFFCNILENLPQNGLFVFNNTRVVQARLIFYKPTGARIELFCLEPANLNTSMHDAYCRKSSVVWKCFIGNAKKWKENTLEISDSESNSILKAEKVKKTQDTFLVKFSWQPSEISFASVLERFGRTPLPPYIQREDNIDDRIRYQTLYSAKPGSVAAPTAGLHFSKNILNKIDERENPILNITLHVGAGTFKPVTTNYVNDHNMHKEQFSVSLKTIKVLLEEYKRPFVIVGTTTVRTLESLYWFGVGLLQSGSDEQSQVIIDQWEPYRYNFDNLPSRKDALTAIYNWMCNNNKENITGITSLMIVPGYTYKLTDILVTNFHQPASTLLLLVAAFVGEDWRKIYNYALNNNFRFLSYGDCCLLYKNQ